MSAYKADPQRRRLTVGQESAEALRRSLPDDGDGSPTSAEDGRAGDESLTSVQAWQQDSQDADVTLTPDQAQLQVSRNEKAFKELFAGTDAVCLSSKLDHCKIGHYEDKKLEVHPFLSSRPSETKVLDELVAQDRNVQAIAYKCKKGKKPDAPNQDSFSIVLSPGEFGLYCVFDGHGPEGHFVSDLVRKDLVAEFLLRIKVGDRPIQEAFEQSFKKTQKRLEALSKAMKPDAMMSGTTCTMAYHDEKEQRLHIAHVGDSRAVIGFADKEGSIQDLPFKTEDHKPELVKEKTRIEAAGGRVLFDNYFNHRVYSAKGNYPGLNMSRALGDVVGHQEAGLSAVPDYKEVSLAEQKATGGKVFLLLCTDGVWEFIEDPEAIDIVNKGRPVESKRLHETLENLTKESFDKWMKDSEGEISDDITGIAVIL